MLARLKTGSLLNETDNHISTLRLREVWKDMVPRSKKKKKLNTLTQIY